MEQQGDKLERYLAEFQPRAVRKLGVSPKGGHSWQRWLAAAAVVVCCLGTGYWQMRHARLKVKGMQLKSQTLLLTRIAMRDEKMFDQFLTDRSHNVLPSCQGEKSTLRV